MHVLDLQTRQRGYSDASAGKGAAAGDEPHSVETPDPRGLTWSNQGRRPRGMWQGWHIEASLCGQTQVRWQILQIWLWSEPGDDVEVCD